MILNDNMNKRTGNSTKSIYETSEYSTLIYRFVGQVTETSIILQGKKLQSKFRYHETVFSNIQVLTIV